VLIRGVEPTRGVSGDVRCDGPGRLARALTITRADNGADLVASPHLYVSPRTKRPRIAATPRVGVAYAGEIAEAPWRFFDPMSAHVSRPPLRSIGLGGGRKPR
jgi:DNA-3-methyladenine glycosylase